MTESGKIDEATARLVSTESIRYPKPPGEESSRRDSSPLGAEFSQEPLNGALIVDPQSGLIRAADQAAARHLGCSQNELISTAFSDLFPAGTAPSTARLMKWSDDETAPVHIVRRVDGSPCSLQVRLSRMESDDGPMILATVQRPQSAAPDPCRMEPVRQALYNVFEHSRDAVYVTTVDGRLIDCNEALSDLLGYSRHEMFDVNVQELYENPTERVRFQEEVEQTGFAKDFEVTLLRRGGARLSCLLTSTPRVSADGRIVGYEGIIRDISDSKRTEYELRQSRDILEALLNASSEAAFLLDRDGRFLALNQTTAERFNRSVADMIGTSAFDPLPEETAKYRRGFFDRVLKEGRAVRFVDERDGRHSDIAFYPVFGLRSDVTMVAVYSRDITERKRSEERLKQAHDDLETLVLERTAELVRANESLRQEIAERRKAEESLAAELKKFRALYDLAVALTAERSLEDNLMMVVEKSRELLAADTAYIALRDEVEGSVRMKTLSGIRTEAFKQMEIPFGSGLGGKVASTGKGYIVEDYFSETDSTVHNIVRAEGLISGIAVPVRVGQTNLGVLYVFNRSSTRFTSSDLDTLTLLGHLAAVEITHKRAEENLQRSHVELERQVEERTAQLREMNRQLRTEVSEREKAQEALSQSEQMLSNILANSPLGIAYFEKGRLRWSNQAMFEMFGHTGESDYLGKHASEFYESAAEYERVRAVFLGDLAQSQPSEVEARLKRSDGAVFYGLLKAGLVDPGDPGKGMISTVSDISARKIAEDRLRESEERYRTLVEESFDGIFVQLDDEIVFANSRLYEMLGYDEGELAGMEPDVIYAPEHWKSARRRLSARLRGESEADQFEVRLRRKDGSSFHAEINARAVALGEDTGIQVWVRDIENRKQAERALRDSEEKYRTILETIEDVYYEVDVHGNFRFLNDSAVKTFGYNKEELIGRNYRDFMTWTDAAKADELFTRVYRTGEPVKAYDLKFVTADGAERHIEISVSAVPGSGRAAGFRGICRDVTQRKRAEEELLKLQKLESIGVLGGGIAHDFNNILTAIQGNISVAKLHLNPDEKAFEKLTEAEKAGARARDLTQQLLTFAKGGAPIKQTASIYDIVRESCEFALRGSNVGFTMTVPKDISTVEVDEVQISRVIGNLVINADHAMPEGGLIEVRLEDRRVTGGDETPLPEGDYVHISVSDQGVGISEDVLPKVFDPYFTTKSEGSGLGLATAYSIVKNHDGLITVESEPGLGTTFQVYLPASRKTAEARMLPDDKVAPGKGRILLMDDEEQIRDLAEELLTLLGYTARTARDGAEAVDLYERELRRGRRFDAVILDLTVPGGMGGMEAARRLRIIDPHVRSIVSSGYSNDPIMADYARYGFHGVIPKPYDARRLSVALREALEG